MEWYFLRVQVGREDRIRENMILRLKQAGLEHLVPEIIVPKETVADHRGGKRRIQKRKLGFGRPCDGNRADRCVAGVNVRGAVCGGYGGDGRGDRLVVRSRIVGG